MGMKTSSIWDAIAYREELEKMPRGFFPFKAENGNRWNIYFKLSTESNRI